jgi:hypothetical protein
MDSSYFSVIGILGALGAYSVWSMKKGFAQSRKLHEEVQATGYATVSGIAQRLGMQVVEGDPYIHVIKFWDLHRFNCPTIRCQGSPYGRFAQFDLSYKHGGVDLGVIAVSTTSFGCFLTIQPHVHIPDFEVVYRNPGRAMEARRLVEDAPWIPTNDMMIDATYKVASHAPGIGGWIAQLLRPVPKLSYFHLACHRGQLVVSFTPESLEAVGQYAETYHYLLECTARTFEGQPMVPRMTFAATTPVMGQVSA